MSGCVLIPVILKPERKVTAKDINVKLTIMTNKLILDKINQPIKLLCHKKSYTL